MDSLEVSQIIGFFGVATAIAGWVHSDGRSKARNEATNATFEAFRIQQEKINIKNNAEISILNIQFATSAKDREDLHSSINRIDSTKASKEVVDGFQKEMTMLRQDMRERFDKIEMILNEKH